MRKYLNLRPNIALGLVIAFLANTLGPLPSAKADEFRLPVPGAMVPLSPESNPPVLKGIKVHPDNPFRFDFILDQGGSGIGSPSSIKEESTRLIKYFLASLTIPEKDLWVNLSPYEKNRIVPESFGRTEMGRDLLAEDYMLKQITASLIYPEGETGKRFWKRVYEEAAKRFGTTNIPVNTFNKVWIVPEKAVVYENAKAGTAYVVEAKLKVMLEQDYLALEKHTAARSDVASVGADIVREIVIPELTKEVNEGKNFAQLRQVYDSLILATWYKKKIKDSILAQVYEDKKKVAGIVSLRGSETTEAIYQHYLQAFKKGVYNYIKEEQDPITQGPLPRKYFSGGASLYRVDAAMLISEKPPVDLNVRAPLDVTADLAMETNKSAEDLYDFSKREIKVRVLEDLLKEAMGNIGNPGRAVIVGGTRYMRSGARKDVDVLLQRVKDVSIWKSYVRSLADVLNKIDGAHAEIIDLDVGSAVRIENMALTLTSKSGQSKKIKLDILSEWDIAFKLIDKNDIFSTYFSAEYYAGDHKIWNQRLDQYYDPVQREGLSQATLFQRSLELQKIWNQLPEEERHQRANRLLESSAAANNAMMAAVGRKNWVERLRDVLQVNYFVARRMADILEINNKNEKMTVFILPTGGTSEGIYAAFIKIVKERRIGLAWLDTFNMDEYYLGRNYPGDWSKDPQSYRDFMEKHLFSQLRGLGLGWDDNNAHFLNGQAEDIDQEVKRYEKLIRDKGPVDLVVGGIGSDGHIAFNEPIIPVRSIMEADLQQIRDFNEFHLVTGKDGLNSLLVNVLYNHWLHRQRPEFANMLIKGISTPERLVSQVDTTALSKKLLKQKVTIYLDLSEKEISGIEKGLRGHLLAVARHLGLSSPQVEFRPSAEISRSRTRHVQLAVPTIIDNARFFDDILKIPTEALTVGMGTMMDAKEIMIAATGEKKANAVYNAVRMAPSSEVSASYLQEHPNVAFVLDPQAAAKLDPAMAGRSSMRKQSDAAMTFDQVSADIIRNSVLDPWFVQYNRVLRSIINPEGKAFTVAVGFPGADVSNLWLATGFTKAYWVHSNARNISSENFREALGSWNKLNTINDYFEEKSYFGSNTHFLADKDTARHIIEELKAMGAIGVHLNDGNEINPELLFLLPGDVHYRSIEFINEGIVDVSPQLSRMMLGRLDAYYEKGAQQAVVSYPQRFRVYSDWLRPGGLMIVSPYATKDRYIDLNVYLPAGFKDLMQGNNEIEGLIRTHRADVGSIFRNYGWNMEIWQKPGLNSVLPGRLPRNEEEYRIRLIKIQKEVLKFLNEFPGLGRIPYINVILGQYLSGNVDDIALYHFLKSELIPEFREKIPKILTKIGELRQQLSDSAQLGAGDQAMNVQEAQKRVQEFLDKRKLLPPDYRLEADQIGRTVVIKIIQINHNLSLSLSRIIGPNLQNLVNVYLKHEVVPIVSRDPYVYQFEILDYAMSTKLIVNATMRGQGDRAMKAKAPDHLNFNIETVTALTPRLAQAWEVIRASAYDPQVRTVVAKHIEGMNMFPRVVQITPAEIDRFIRQHRAGQLSRIEDLMTTGHLAFFFAWSGGRLLGYALAQLYGYGPETWVISEFAVGHGFRGRGVGTGLFEAAFEYLKHKPEVKKVLVHDGSQTGDITDVGFTGSIAMRLGFKVIRKNVYEFDKSDHDGAMSAPNGGIDLTSNKALSVQNNGQGIKFHIDPAQLAQLQNSTGFVPVIIKVRPVHNLAQFLGIDQGPRPQEELPLH